MNPKERHLYVVVFPRYSMCKTIWDIPRLKLCVCSLSELDYFFETFSYFQICPVTAALRVIPFQYEGFCDIS